MSESFDRDLAARIAHAEQAEAMFEVAVDDLRKLEAENRKALAACIHESVVGLAGLKELLSWREVLSADLQQARIDMWLARGIARRLQERRPPRVEPPRVACSCRILEFRR